MIAKCNCVSPIQDAQHGRLMRVFNVGVKAATCTVCGNKINLPAKNK